MARLTKQRQAIERAFALAGRPLSPAEVHALAAKQLAAGSGNAKTGSASRATEPASRATGPVERLAEPCIYPSGSASRATEPASRATLGLSTVYRTLRRLEAEGLIVAVTVPGEAPRYELAHIAADHHHHFHCRLCGRVFDIHGCPTGLEAMAPPRFVVEDHTVVLHGLCDRCR